MTEVKYPNITVNLSEGDGNAFSIIGKMIKALKLNSVPEEEIAEFQKEAKSGNYDHLLQTCMNWVNVE